MLVAGLPEELGREAQAAGMDPRRRQACSEEIREEAWGYRRARRIWWWLVENERGIFWIREEAAGWSGRDPEETRWSGGAVGSMGQDP